MKTNFTLEEMKIAYFEEVLNYLVNDYSLSIELSNSLIKQSNLENDFIANIEHYEFIEPSKIAKKIFKLFNQM